MKKKIICFLLAVMFAFSLTACSAPLSETDVEPNYVVTPEAVTTTMNEFFDAGLEDRTSFLDGETKAYNYIRDQMIRYGYGEESMRRQEFALYDTRNKEYKSQNLIVNYQSEVESARTIVLLANYDNSYNSVTAATATHTNGALDNATGTVALMTIARHVKQFSSNYNFEFVFYGAGAESYGGIDHYVTNLSNARLANMILAVEFKKLGGDELYTFFDGKETPYQTFFADVAKNNGLSFKLLPPSAAAAAGGNLDGVSYSHTLTYGGFSYLFNAGVPTINIRGGNFDTFYYGDVESAQNANIGSTSNDTLANLKSYYPDYDKKIASAASLLLHAIGEDGFTPAMVSTYNAMTGNDTVNLWWLWYLLLLVVIIGCFAAVTFNMRSYAKKHPIAPVTPKRVRVAVFGTDYEDTSGDDIFVDIKPKQTDAYGSNGIFSSDYVIPTGANKNPLDIFDYSDEPSGKVIGGDNYGQNDSEQVKTADEVAEVKTAESSEKGAEVKTAESSEEVAEVKTVESSEEVAEVKTVESSDDIAEVKTAESSEKVAEVKTVESSDEDAEVKTAENSDEVAEVKTAEKVTTRKANAAKNKKSDANANEDTPDKTTPEKKSPKKAQVSAHKPAATAAPKTPRKSAANKNKKDEEGDK